MILLNLKSLQRYKTVILLLIIWLESFGLSQAQEKSVKVGVYENHPIVYRDKNGSFRGLAVDVLEEIASKEKWELEYVFGSWAECIERLDRGEIDVLVNIAFSKERAKKYDYNSEVLISNWGTVYTRPNSNIETLLDLEGKRVALLKRSIHPPAFLKLVDSFGIDLKTVTVDSYEQGLKLVGRAEADAVVVNRIFGLSHSDEYNVEKTVIIFNPIENRYATPKGENADLLLAIDKHLKALKSDKSSIYYQSFNEAFKLSTPLKTIPIWIYLGLVLVLGVILVLFLLNRFQNREIKARTKALQSEIDDRKLIEESLRLSEQLFRQFFNHMLEYAYIASNKGYLVDVNLSVLQELGYSRDELVGQPLSKIYAPESLSKMQGLFKRWRDRGQIVNEEMEIITKAGVIRTVLLNVGTIKDKEGRILHSVSVQTDITDRKRAEDELKKHQRHLEKLVKERTAELESKNEKLEESQKALTYLLEDINESRSELEQANVRLQQADRLKSIFLASMSHELRTPLNSIIGFTGIILMGMVGEISDEQKTQLTKVKHNAHHLLNLVNDVLDISKIEAGKVELDCESFPFSSVVDEVLDSLFSKVDQDKLELVKDVPDNIAIYSDRRRVKQVLLNLVGNAVKFTDEGTVKITAQVRDNTLLEVRVVDTGIGIKSEDQARLFAPFQQVDILSLTKQYEGTGLGLYLSRKLLDLMGGSIGVKSEPGKGSDFFFTLPLQKEGEADNEKDIGR